MQGLALCLHCLSSTSSFCSGILLAPQVSGAPFVIMARNTTKRINSRGTNADTIQPVRTQRKKVIIENYQNVAVRVIAKFLSIESQRCYREHGRVAFVTQL